MMRTSHPTITRRRSAASRRDSAAAACSSGRRRRRLALIFFRLPLFVVAKVVENGRGVSVRVHYLEHHYALVGQHFLRVARVGHRLVLVVLQTNVTQRRVGHVFDVDPAHAKLSAPLVLRPHGQRRRHVHRRRHLGHAAKVARTVDGKVKVHRTFAIPFVVRDKKIKDK